MDIEKIKKLCDNGKNIHFKKNEWLQIVKDASTLSYLLKHHKNYMDDNHNSIIYYALSTHQLKPTSLLLDNYPDYPRNASFFNIEKLMNKKSFFHHILKEFHFSMMDIISVVSHMPKHPKDMEKTLELLTHKYHQDNIYVSVIEEAIKNSFDKNFSRIATSLFQYQLLDARLPQISEISHKKIKL